MQSVYLRRHVFVKLVRQFDWVRSLFAMGAIRSGGESYPSSWVGG